MLTTTDYHTAGEPFRIVRPAVRRSRGGRCADRAGAADRRPARSTRARGCSATSRAGTPTCTAASSSRRTTTAPTSGCCSGTRTASRPRAGTARSPSATGRSSPVSSRRPRDGEVDDRRSTCPSGRVARACARDAGRVDGGATSSTCRRTCSPRGVAGGDRARDGVVDLSYGGAIYASARRAAASGCGSSRSTCGELIARAARSSGRSTTGPRARHPDDPRLSGVYGTIWYERARRRGRASTSATCTVFADGEVDRSPCGSGTSARLALLDDSGELADGAELRARAR